MPGPTPATKPFPAAPTTIDVRAIQQWMTKVREWASQFVIDLDPPGPIPDATAEANNAAVILRWSPAKKAAFYWIYRGTTGNFTAASLIHQVTASKTKVANYTFQDSQDQTVATRVYWIVPLNERLIVGPKTPMLTTTNFYAATDSTAFGVNAKATGDASVAIGPNANASGASTVAIGDTAQAPSGVAIGYHAATNAGGTVSIGGQTTADGVNDIVIGEALNSSGFSNVIMIGQNFTPTANQQFIASGGPASPITDVYFGEGVTKTSAPDGYTIHGTGGSGTDKVGGDLKLAGGASTGSGNGGSVYLQTTTPGASSSIANVVVNRVQCDTKGNVVVGTAALATNATDGFLYVDSCAGVPTGTPTTFTGRVPIVVDTTNSRLYAYFGGSWKLTVLS